MKERFNRHVGAGESIKRASVIVVAALFLSHGWAHGMVPAPANRPQGNDPIPSIRRRYAVINQSLAKYKVVKKELSGFSAEGGELIAYFDGPSVVKMAATYYGETGRSFEEFYYRDEKLIFVFRKQETYDRPLSGKVVKTREDRFYFNDDKLIRWIDEGGKQVAPGDSRYPETQARYLAGSKLFAEGARAQEPAIEAPDLKP